LAIKTNAVIVLGKLKGIRNRIKAGRRVRRLANNFPYYRLVQYIQYKAEWAGIQVMEISEAYTSQTCFACGKRDKKSRKTQGLFQCKNKDCRQEMNAEYNVAMNILQRGLGILSSLGGIADRRLFVRPLPKTNLIYPEPSVIADRSKMITKEPHTL
jgi:putative transposase